MRLKELKKAALERAGQTEDDLSRLGDTVLRALNTAYDEMSWVLCCRHVGPDAEDVPPLRGDASEPLLPAFLHDALVDSACAALLREGGQSARAAEFELRFRKRVSEVRNLPMAQKADYAAQLEGSGSRRIAFVNIPV